MVAKLLTDLVCQSPPRISCAVSLSDAPVLRDLKVVMGNIAGKTPKIVKTPMISMIVGGLSLRPCIFHDVSACSIIH